MSKTYTIIYSYRTNILKILENEGQQDEQQETHMINQPIGEVLLFDSIVGLIEIYTDRIRIRFGEGVLSSLMDLKEMLGIN